ncbi:glycine betaine ABC transporter substrate-binding protein [Neorhodopirellula lusitana]|uniref:glycine betaine ABC transporter substrate-binding protein n=1 Tax=Neorhodopirellula lusitana TaxID=445327 RepID=UPI00384CEB22
MSKQIVIGVTNLSSHHVTGSLVDQVLTELGFDAERVYSTHETNFKKLKSGEVDMLASTWLPSNSLFA